MLITLGGNYALNRGCLLIMEAIIEATPNLSEFSIFFVGVYDLWAQDAVITVALLLPRLLFLAVQTHKHSLVPPSLPPTSTCSSSTSTSTGDTHGE